MVRAALVGSVRQQERRLLRGSGSGSLRVALWLIGVFGIITIVVVVVLACAGWFTCLVAKDQMVPDRRSSTVEPVPPRDEEALPAFRCGHCGHVFHVQDAVPGSQFICPNCGAANNV
mmetsp:Transcript_27622/g.85330  ORF Transcript_27622/g.85330 Transcript_27622/m.85330 type:complete len:117 (-) Transcript_27622:1267-1617(-)